MFFKDMHTLFAVLLAACIAGAPAAAVAGAEADLERATRARESAEASEAPLLSPGRYAEGVTALDRGRQRESEAPGDAAVLRLLAEAVAHFSEAAAHAGIARQVFSDVLASREAARDAEAWRLVTATWQRAEERFLDAARRLEKGDADAATETAAEAAASYRDAGLQAVRSRYLAGTWSLLLDAERSRAEKLSPLTLASARRLLAEAEAQLAANVTEPDKAADSIEAANAEARHAISLARAVAELRDSEQTPEQVLLAIESGVSRAAEGAGLGPRQVIGDADAMARLIADARALGQRTATLERELVDRDRHIAGLEDEIRELDRRLGGTVAERDQLMVSVEAQKRQREQLQSIESLFTPDEGTVLQESGNIVLRLHGLSFAPGSASLRRASEATLGKARRALALFPRASITIEGHTDASGSEAANLKLSAERARALEQSLATQLQLSGGRTRVVGYGESRPLASNDTSEGRARNRRIDIVISPDPATWGR
jgi:outer membrane protein OmpA-like peptidoglycan-associated protein